MSANEEIGAAAAALIVALFSEDLLGQTLEQILGYGVGGAIEPAIAVAVQGFVNDLWSTDPSAPLDPATAALSFLRNPNTGLDPEAEARLTGINGDRQLWIQESLLAPADVGSVLQLLQRNIIDQPTAITYLTRGGMQQQSAVGVVQLAEQILSAPDLAMARQQQFIDQGEQYTKSGLVGVSNEDAELLFKLAGLPPGIGEGLTLLRRGLIDEARFAQYVAEGHTKTKYTPDLLDLRYIPLSASVAAEAVLRERMTAAEGQALAEKNGIAAADFTKWVEILGRPPGIMEGLTLLNRKKITEADFREIVARSDVRTEYADDLLELRIHYPSLFQISRALANGTATPALASDTLELLGYAPEWVAAIVGAGGKDATVKHKEISLSIIETLFDAGIETEPQATTAIEALGYTAEQTAELLQLHEARRYVSELVRAVNGIRAKFVGHVIDATQAQVLLDKLQLSAASKQNLFGLWQTEQQANVRTLTPAQVGQALKYNILTADQAIARWQTLGYSLDDATILAEIVGKGPPHPPAVPA